MSSFKLLLSQILLEQKQGEKERGAVIPAKRIAGPGRYLIFFAAGAFGKDQRTQVFVSKRGVVLSWLWRVGEGCIGCLFL